MRDKTAVMDALWPAFVSMLLFWPIAISAYWTYPQLVPLVLAIGMSIHWPVIGWMDDIQRINPPELRILEREIRRVPHGRAIVIPFSERTHGHGSHTHAVLWKPDLEELLQSPER